MMIYFLLPFINAKKKRCLCFCSNGWDKAGFTAVEVLWVLGIIGIIFAFVSVNLISFSRKSALSSTVSMLISDIRQQQLKAMMGDGGSLETPSNYGVYFQQTSYVLYKGDSYNPADPQNFVVTLEGNLQFSTPSAQVNFSRSSGLIPAPSAQAIIDTTNGEMEEIQLNKYGVITNRVRK